MTLLDQIALLEHATDELVVNVLYQLASERPIQLVFLEAQHYRFEERGEFEPLVRHEDVGLVSPIESAQFNELFKKLGESLLGDSEIVVFDKHAEQHPQPVGAHGGEPLRKRYFILLFPAKVLVAYTLHRRVVNLALLAQHGLFEQVAEVWRSGDSLHKPANVQRLDERGVRSESPLQSRTGRSRQLPAEGGHLGDQGSLIEYAWRQGVYRLAHAVLCEVVERGLAFALHFLRPCPLVPAGVSAIRYSTLTRHYLPHFFSSVLIINLPEPELVGRDFVASL